MSLNDKQNKKVNPEFVGDSNYHYGKGSYKVGRQSDKDVASKGYRLISSCEYIGREAKRKGND